MSTENAVGLMERLKRLDQRLVTVGEKLDQAKRVTRRVTLLTACLAVAVLALALLAWQQHEQAQDLKSTQVTNCENANNSRAAQRYLWDTLIVQSGQRNPDQTPAQRRYAKAFGRFVHDIFADRDCTDLNREYPLPAPPNILGTD